MSEKKTYVERAAEMRRQQAQLKARLEKEFGVEGHPKANKLFELAWEHGHSYGDNEVASYYGDFVELILEPEPIKPIPMPDPYGDAPCDDF